MYLVHSEHETSTALQMDWFHDMGDKSKWLDCHSEKDKLVMVNGMVCPPVRGDNPQALAHGLSPVQADKPWHNYFIPPSSV